jgi:four helix bundle protein
VGFPNLGCDRVKDLREPKVWQRSHTLTLAVDRLTKKFPKDELFGLTNQMRRASASIPANIAEGCGRDGDAELKHFLNIALGSTCELDYHLLLATELGYIDAADSKLPATEVLEIRRMLGTFIQKLKA